MPRRARIILPGLPHHVTQRGNRRQQVFFCDNDYRAYLKFLETSSESFGFAIWSYCLMPNHVHLLVVPSTESSLREGIASVHQNYTRLINSSHHWTGHLWQGRFFSCAVEPHNAAIVARYIELNPARAKICADPRAYPWSSANIACSGGSDGRSGFAPIYSPGGTWEEFLKYESDDASRNNLDTLTKIRKTISSGRPLGSDEFIEKIERETGIVMSDKRPGRKPCSELSNRHLGI